MWNRKYSLSKSHGVLKWCYQWYEKNWQSLPKGQLARFEQKMESLDGSIQQGDKSESNYLAKDLEKYGHSFIKSSPFHYAREIVFALLIALALAVVVRMTWFELYVIPTGSMRPTFKEQDHLIVSKTTHGINIPFMTDHFIFDPDLVVRGNPVIWSGDQLDIPNNDTKYFWVFPYKKRYIKRLIGKPGDTIYFYGGQIYGLDRDGKEIVALRNNPHMKGIDHVPFASFEGKEANVKPDKSGAAQQTVFLHFNRPYGAVSFDWLGNAKGDAMGSDRYDDAFGMKNFALARLLTSKQLKSLYPNSARVQPKAELYLELKHHPSLKGQVATLGRQHTLLPTDVSIIPLDKEHQQALMNAMYTARFEVENGRAKLYSESPRPFSSYSATLSGIPDGRYEFYYGKAYSIGFKGLSSELPSDHPLYDRKNLQKLFNLGTNFYTFYSPNQAQTVYSPPRYAYFRDGNLFVMGSPIFTKDDPTLVDFVEKESKKEQGFVDQGSPSVETIQKYGIHIPEKHYLVLGDNHAMSADSRFFGFVPEENLQGTPTFIFWPPGSRWGFPNQISHPYLTIPNVTVTTIIGVVGLIWYIIHRRNLKKALYKKLSH